MPALGDAGRKKVAGSLPSHRLSRGRWRRIDYAREQQDFEHLRALERYITTRNEYRRRFDERSLRRG